jgi:ribose 5-phosphate isomerase B
MTRRPLIPEREVMLAQREGRTSIDAMGAVVTPAARDAAAKHGIALSAAASAPGGEPPLPVRPVAISAPDSTAGTETLNGRPHLIALGADHGGVPMKDALLAWLRQRGLQADDLGTFGAQAVDYPDFAIAVARTVASGAADIGIMIDGAGIGSCMAANKVAGVRTAMCYDVTTTANAREHNSANVLTLGGTLLGVRLAQEIVRTFLETPFAGGRHAARVSTIDALDR